MKSASNENTSNLKITNDAIDAEVIKSLDQSTKNLPTSTLSELANIRQNVLLQMTEKKQGILHTVWQYVMPSSDSFSRRIALPVAAVIIITLSYNYQQIQIIPALPVAAINATIPIEDLNLLEDIEFVTWLAENEKEVLL